MLKNVMKSWPVLPDLQTLHHCIRWPISAAWLEIVYDNFFVYVYSLLARHSSVHKPIWPRRVCLRSTLGPRSVCRRHSHRRRGDHTSAAGHRRNPHPPPGGRRQPEGKRNRLEQLLPQPLHHRRLRKHLGRQLRAFPSWRPWFHSHAHWIGTECSSGYISWRPRANNRFLPGNWLCHLQRSSSSRPQCGTQPHPHHKRIADGGMQCSCHNKTEGWFCLSECFTEKENQEETLPTAEEIKRGAIPWIWVFLFPTLFLPYKADLLIYC